MSQISFIKKTWNICLMIARQIEIETWFNLLETK